MAADHAQIIDAVYDAFAGNQRDFPFVALKLTDREVEGALAPLISQLRLEDIDTEGSFIPLPEGKRWPSGAWDRSPAQALAMSIPSLGDDHGLGVLILGLNPYRPEDKDIQNIAKLAAGKIGAALANVMALGNEKRRADRIWSVSRDIIVVVDHNGSFVSVSPSWTRILGHDVDQVIGRHFADFMHPEDIAPSHDALSRALGDNDLDNYENRFRDIQGNYHNIEWHTTLEGGLVYAYGRDVTDRRLMDRELEAARQALVQAQKMEAIGQLTGGIAHDFNNLLMAIMSSLELLQKRLPAEAKAKRLLNVAKEGAQRGAMLTQRMLAFARRQELTLSEVDVPRLLGDMRELIQRSIGPEWPISTHFPLHLPKVRADANQLEMALLNLVVNARDATPAGGTIEIFAESSDALPTKLSNAGNRAFVRLVVADHGTGMDPETLRRSTEPFFTTKGVGKGTGLGLPMVHGMAQQLGGAFELDSEQGRGTKAILWLPISNGEDIKITVEAEKRLIQQSPKLTVLVVDDDPPVLMNTVSLVEDLGHKAIGANAGSDALAKFRNHDRIDLIITDQAMPKMTGTQFLAAADQIHPGIPAIVASGYSDGLVIDGREVERIGKPFSQLQLASAIASATGRSRDKGAV